MAGGANHEEYKVSEFVLMRCLRTGGKLPAYSTESTSVKVVDVGTPLHCAIGDIFKVSQDDATALVEAGLAEYYHLDRQVREAVDARSGSH